MFHLISFPVVGLIGFFFKKKKAEDIKEVVCIFLLALFLHLFLIFLAASEVIALSLVPYFTEKAFSLLFVCLKIILIVSQSILIFVELRKKSRDLCRPIFARLPLLKSFHAWLCQVTLAK